MLRLADVDPDVAKVLREEAQRQQRNLELIASENFVSEAVPVRARILATDALSAHADRGELLVWLSGFRRPPAMTYTVHGEPAAAAALRYAIARELGWACAVAADAQCVSL